MDTIVNTSDAKYRPMGLAQGPDGSLYISDSHKGKLWRIMYKGDKTTFGTEQLSLMEKRKMSAHIRTPDEVADNLQKDVVKGGQTIYRTYCVACHSNDGKGDGLRFPSLDSSEYVLTNKKRLINILLNGLQIPITVKGTVFTNKMPSHSFLSDKDIALVLTYIRQNFHNNASEILPKEVTLERNNSNTK